MTDDLEGLDAKLLRGMLPALYKKAQDGDQRAIDTVLRILQRLEKNAPLAAPNEPAEPGFTAPINVPGQIQSRASRKEFEALLESPPTDDPFVGEGILQLSDAYFRQMEDGENDDKWDWRKHAYVAWACIPKNMRYRASAFASPDGLAISRTKSYEMILVHPQKLDQFLASFEMSNSQLSFLGLSPATDAEWLEWIGELAAEERNRREQSNPTDKP